jgi:hypothetical protein
LSYSEVIDVMATSGATAWAPQLMSTQERHGAAALAGVDVATPATTRVLAPIIATAVRRSVRGSLVRMAV